MKNTIIIYCDGGCRGNQKKDNIGGWGAILTQNGTDNKKEIYGNKVNTTNNQMELTACIKSLEAIRRDVRPICNIEIHSDSAYLVNGMNSWIHSWIKKNWRNSQKKPVENKELWQQILALTKQFEDVTFNKCKGHDGVELNERADELANIAMDELENKDTVDIDKNTELQTILESLKSNKRNLEELNIRGYIEDAVQNLDLVIENINDELDE
ncbi:ribonuclease HI [Clostridium botulinum]|uniref:ribonuclease HI n=1 Tax=Clostridium botulinum TaxID=1491 RepID=UPI00090B940C|nr:ribonuclease HI [Clostridium botulinum]APH20862.1 RNase H family protein [Clostridium botulinum]APQ71233.1 RNase H family protein [Clostridium botulinum]MBN3379270.1 ribonuclease HI [Clostridium botulinum]